MTKNSIFPVSLCCPANERRGASCNSARTENSAICVRWKLYCSLNKRLKKYCTVFVPVIHKMLSHTFKCAFHHVCQPFTFLFFAPTEPITKKKMKGPILFRSLVEAWPLPKSVFTVCKSGSSVSRCLDRHCRFMSSVSLHCSAFLLHFIVTVFTSYCIFSSYFRRWCQTRFSASLWKQTCENGFHEQPRTNHNFNRCQILWWSPAGWHGAGTFLTHFERLFETGEADPSFTAAIGCKIPHVCLSYGYGRINNGKSLLRGTHTKKSILPQDVLLGYIPSQCRFFFQVLYSRAWIHLEWQDTKLQWNTTQFEGVINTRMPPALIWTPDIHLDNAIVENLGMRIRFLITLWIIADLIPVVIRCSPVFHEWVQLANLQTLVFLLVP